MNKLKEVKVCSIQLFQLTFWEDKLKLSFSSDLWKKSFFATLNFSIVILELKVVCTSGKKLQKNGLRSGKSNVSANTSRAEIHISRFPVHRYEEFQRIPSVPFRGLAE